MEGMKVTSREEFKHILSSHFLVILPIKGEMCSFFDHGLGVSNLCSLPSKPIFFSVSFCLLLSYPSKSPLSGDHAVVLGRAGQQWHNSCLGDRI